MKSPAIILVLGLISFANLNNALAQNRTDFGIWAGVQMSQKLVKGLTGRYSSEIRLDGNATYFQTVFFDVGLNYKFHDMFNATLGYRYNMSPQKNRHRGYLDLNFSYTPGETRLTLKARVRTLYQTSEFYNDLPSTVIRPRLYLNYNPKGKVANDFNFYIAGEIFYELAQNYNQVNQYRFMVGATYDLSTEVTLNLRYILQDEIGVAAPIQDHIICLELQVNLPKFDFKKKNKKDEEEKDKDKKDKDKDKKDKDVPFDY